jgi:serine/tyrosine/threonine adenylyltransferase
MPLASPVPVRHTVRFGFDCTYACLEQCFYARLAPKPVAVPRLVKRNVKFAPNLGIDVDIRMSAEGIDILGATA